MLSKAQSSSTTASCEFCMLQVCSAYVLLHSFFSHTHEEEDLPPAVLTSFDHPSCTDSLRRPSIRLRNCLQILS